MQHHIQTLVKHFFQKESLRDVTLHQLQQFTEEYPWSAAGQLLLAKKLRDTNAQDFADQGAKLSLYCSDPVWAAWLLRPDGQSQQTTGDALFDAFFQAEEPVYKTAGAFPEYQQPPVPPPADGEVAAPGEHDISAASPAALPPAADADPDLQELSNEHVNGLQPGEGTLDADEAPASPPAEAAGPLPKIPGPLPVPATADGGGEDIPFEPYHTIDYFASVGIKLKPEDLASDKLGQQLKSFTEWLRSMKRVGPNPDAQAIQELDEGTNKQIRRIAETSNEAGEIITEAMAEVWAKQGHREKAAAIYEKLSLLNPAKSHYFASKIEVLRRPL